MKTEEEIKQKLIRVKDAHNYGTNKDTHAYIIQDGFITALEWVLEDKMNEVTKLYENAGVEADYDYFTFFDDKVHKIGRTMHLCKEELKHWLENYQKDYVAIKVIRVDKVYPPFTAEKQIELIKQICPSYPLNYHIRCFQGYTFEEGLAKCVNNLWQCLTEADKAQIKEVLE